MRGQVPGTTCNGARTKSAINNYQASGYVRAEREWRAGISSGTPERTTRSEYRVAEDPLAVVLDKVRRHWLASHIKHYIIICNSIKLYVINTYIHITIGFN